MECTVTSLSCNLQIVWIKYGLLTLGRVSHVRHCFDPVSDLPSSRVTSLLEGLEFTPPSSARTNGDDARNYVYTYLVRIRTFSKIDFPFDEIYRRLLFFTLGRMYHTL